MSNELAEIIKQRIAQAGAISVAEYMALALAHPEYGYYMRRDPLGTNGDFTTAPEISQVFGEIIGIWLAHQWLRAGAPQEIALVELGAGRGTLMADILRATKNIKGFHNAVSVHIVEISFPLRHKQWQNLAKQHQRIEWHETIDTLPIRPLFIVANEFFDALPICQFVNTGGNLQERMIGHDGENFYFLNMGKITETCPSALAIMQKLSGAIKNQGGAGLIIDYGYVGGSNGDTLQAIKNHKYHNVLDDVGKADLTAHVDFTALAEVVQNAGLHATIIPQGAFLMQNGAGERNVQLCERASHEQQKLLISGLKRLADPAEMGGLFKVLVIA